jgi:hypothetical protein
MSLGKMTEFSLNHLQCQDYHKVSNQNAGLGCWKEPTSEWKQMVLSLYPEHCVECFGQSLIEVSEIIKWLDNTEWENETREALPSL